MTTDRYEMEWAERVREIRKTHNFEFAMHYAHEHGFSYVWAAMALFNYKHHKSNPVIYPF